MENTRLYKSILISCIVLLSLTSIFFIAKAHNNIGVATVLIGSEDTESDFYCEDTINGGRVFISKNDAIQGDKVLYIRDNIKSTAKVIMTIEKSNIDIVDAISY